MTLVPFSSPLHSAQIFIAINLLENSKSQVVTFFGDLRKVQQISIVGESGKYLKMYFCQRWDIKQVSEKWTNLAGTRITMEKYGNDVVVGDVGKLKISEIWAK